MERDYWVDDDGRIHTTQPEAKKKEPEWSSGLSDYVDIPPLIVVKDMHMTFTFIGTGLDILASHGPLKAEVTVDGSPMPHILTLAATSNPHPAAISHAMVVPVARGLPHGWHTIKLKSLNPVHIYGYQAHSPTSSYPMGINTVLVNK